MAEILGNTPAVCRASYVHPAVIESYLDGSLPERIRVPAPVAAGHLEELRAVERAVLRFLEEAAGEPAARSA